MDLEFLAFLAIGAAMGGFVNGLAGFGTALFTLGWWLQIMPPLQAVAISIAMGVAPGVQGVWIVRNEIDMRRLLLFLIPGLAGIPLGLSILHLIDAQLLKIVVAGFLLLYGGFFVLRRNLPAIRKRFVFVDGGLGFIGGILGATAGLSGALPTMWLAMQDLTKGQSRALLQPYNTCVLGVSAILLAIDGAYQGETLIAALIALPITLVAAQAGIWTFSRLTDMRFRRLLIILMFLSGIMLIARELF
jgi:uncharacterized membrane protein YfcA